MAVSKHYTQVHPELPIMEKSHFLHEAVMECWG